MNKDLNETVAIAAALGGAMDDTLRILGADRYAAVQHDALLRAERDGAGELTLAGMEHVTGELRRAAHEAAELSAHLEGRHGAWLDRRIERGLDIALGEPVHLHSDPTAARVSQLEGTVKVSATRDGDTGRWVCIADAATGAVAGWTTRLELLSAIAAMADTWRPAKGAAG